MVDSGSRQTRARLRAAKRLKRDLKEVELNFKTGNIRANQTRQLGIRLAQTTAGLKQQEKLQATAVRTVAQRRCIEIGGVWIDEEFKSNTPSFTIKAQSEAYFPPA